MRTLTCLDQVTHGSVGKGAQDSWLRAKAQGLAHAYHW